MTATEGMITSSEIVEGPLRPPLMLLLLRCFKLNGGGGGGVVELEAGGLVEDEVGGDVVVVWCEDVVGVSDTRVGPVLKEERMVVYAGS